MKFIIDECEINGLPILRETLLVASTATRLPSIVSLTRDLTNCCCFFALVYTYVISVLVLITYLRIKSRKVGNFLPSVGISAS